MTEPLLPCPFKVVPHFNMWTVYGPIVVPVVFEIQFNAEKVAESLNEAWNRRPQPPPVAQVEVYRRALEEIVREERNDWEFLKLILIAKKALAAIKDRP